jgi:hypothetical protein
MGFKIIKFIQVLIKVIDPREHGNTGLSAGFDHPFYFKKGDVLIMKRTYRHQQSVETFFSKVKQNALGRFKIFKPGGICLHIFNTHPHTAGDLQNFRQGVGPEQGFPSPNMHGSAPQH